MTGIQMFIYGGITYTITPSTTSVNEGSSVTFTITTVGFGTGTLYWKLVGITGTINDTDFSSPTTAVSAGAAVAITNNAGSFAITVRSDLATEGAESFRAELKTISTTGTTVATSATVSINDTSLTPPPIIAIIATPPPPPIISINTPPPIISINTPPPIISINTPPPIISINTPPPIIATCVQGDVLVRTANGYVKARDLFIGQNLASYKFNELPDNSTVDFAETWVSNTLTGGEVVETTIHAIKGRDVATTVMFNGSKQRRFSLEHLMLVKRDDVYAFIQAGVIKKGDYLVYDINDQAMDVLVEVVGYVDEITDVYDISVSPYSLFIAGDLIAHNKKGYFQGPTQRDMV